MVTFNGATFWAKGDIELNINLETFNIETSAHGKVDERVKDVQPTLSFVPSGEWESLAVLYPYMSNQSGAIVTVGTEIFRTSGGTAGDSPLIIWTLAGTKYTFPAAAVTKMPDLTLASTKTILGQVQFSFVRADGVAWATANSLYTIDEAAGAPPANTLFSPAAIITQPYACTWQSPLASFVTKEGITFNFDCSFDTVEVDGTGGIGKTLENVGVMGRCMPVGVLESDVLTAMVLQSTGAARGRSMSLTSAGAATADFVCTGTGVVAKVLNAGLKQAGFRFGSTILRVGEIGFVGNRSFPSGVASNLFYVGTS